MLKKKPLKVCFNYVQVLKQLIMKDEWFGTWFNSPYYHILYKNRDYVEAKNFINHLYKYLELEPKHKILDLACGKGRHSIFLNSKGLDVEGVDLSEESILAARKYENEKLHFNTHDMREVYKENSFDFILNMFTSFGYFDSYQENQQAISAAAKGLKNGGTLVLDFFNTNKVVACLKAENVILSEGLTFNITRKIENNTIVKDINFISNEKKYHFQERVKALTKADFSQFFKEANLEIEAIFGDYDLGKYEEMTSERMVFVVRKRERN